MQCRAALRTLGLDSVPRASAADIKAAYLRLAKQHHPDKLAAADEHTRGAGEHQFKLILEAYERLAPHQQMQRSPRPSAGCWTDTLWAGVRSGRFWLWGYASLATLLGVTVAEDWSRSWRGELLRR